ncbi:MAG: hypothetical protein Q9185_000327 [Variospora sp. 1 TL-2023]
MPRTPISEGLRTGQSEWMPALPIIEDDQPLSEVIRELSQIVKWHFSNVENDDRGIFETRGFACEIVAWRFLTHLSKHELIEYLLRELPPVLPQSEISSDDEEASMRRPISARMAMNDQMNERARLLSGDRTMSSNQPKIHEPQDFASEPWTSRTSELVDDDPALFFVGLNALEIATVAGAKRFISQRVVQEVVNGIWSGDIIFWESLSVHTRKRAQKYQPNKADPYCRLRVPKYQKAFEAAFFAIFLVLYYAVLVERNPRYITIVEVSLYIWIAAFAYEEFGEFKDAGTLFYAADFWSLAHIIDVSFDILSLEALFLVPRVCSLLSLNTYFGTLVGSLSGLKTATARILTIAGRYRALRKWYYIRRTARFPVMVTNSDSAQTKDFVKFLGIVVILFFELDQGEIIRRIQPLRYYFRAVRTRFRLRLWQTSDSRDLTLDRSWITLEKSTSFSASSPVHNIYQDATWQG